MLHLRVSPAFLPRRGFSSGSMAVDCALLRLVVLVRVEAAGVGMESRMGMSSRVGGLAAAVMESSAWARDSTAGRVRRVILFPTMATGV